MNRKVELLALSILTGMCLAGIPFVLWLSLKAGANDGQVIGIAIGAYASTLPLLINAIRNVGQGQAMQSMVDYLAKSAPVNSPTDVTVVNTADEPVQTEQVK